MRTHRHILSSRNAAKGPGNPIENGLYGNFTSLRKLHRRLVPLVLFLCLMPGLSRAQNDLANPSSNIVTIPAGSFVIPMDSLNYYTNGANHLFNVNAYGLLFTILDNRTGIHWFIKAGKAKDGIDFTASLQKILPTSSGTATYNLRAGPMVIYPQDTTGIRAIINTFNAKVASSSTGLTKTKVNIYRTTTAVAADQRYILTQTPTVAVLNDGGYGSIHTDYFIDANAPTSNYTTLSGHTLMTGCYTMASQPHNATAVQANLDSIQKFLDYGGNFLAQCEGVTTYENFTNGGSTPGFFQTTEGITKDNVSTTLSYPNPDVGYNQFLGSFDATNVGSSYLETWYLTPAGTNPASVFKNNGYITVDNGTPTSSGSHKYDHFSASAAKILPSTSSGSMMFFVGGHDFGAGTGTNYTNGLRIYFDAMLTPCGPRTSCNSLFFDIDMSVTQTSPTCYGYGDTLTFTVKAKDNGPSSDTETTATVTDTIPTGWTFLSYSATKGTYNSGSGKWSIPDMTYGDSETLTLKVIAKAYTNKTMSAVVIGSAYDQVSSNDTSTVMVDAKPLAETGSNQSICIGQSVQIGGTAVSGDTYSWVSSPSGFTSSLSNPSVTPGMTSTSHTIYTLTETNTTTGCSKSNSVTITVNSLPAAAVASNNNTICSGASISIGATAVPGSTYSWTSSPLGFSSTSSNPSVSPSSTTTYTITETNSNGCINSNSVTITVNPLPSASVASNTIVCSGSSVPIGASATPGDTYSWVSSPAGFASTSSNPTVSPSSTTTYTLTETITATGCEKSSPVTVTINPLPAAATISNSSICSGTSISIGASSVSGSTYSWKSSPVGFSSTTANPTVSPATNTTYTVTETNSNGCVNSNSVTISVNPLPGASVVSNTSICPGASISIGATAVAGDVYSWSGSPSGYSSTLSDPTVTPSVTTTYTLTETITATGCIKSNSVTVTINPIPAAATVLNATICTGYTILIGANPVAGSTYSWVSRPSGFTSTNANPLVSPTVTTTYTLTETNTNGCSKSDSVTITVNSLPAAATAPDTSICSGAAVSIGEASVPGSTYSWNSSPSGFSSTSSNPVVSPTLSITYTLTETNANGCLKSNSVLVTVNPAPNPFISGDNAICEDSATEIYTTAFVSGDSYSWSITGGTILSGQNTNTVYVKWGNAGTGIISVRETNTTYGCLTIVSNDVIIYAKPGAKLITH